MKPSLDNMPMGYVEGPVMRRRHVDLPCEMREWL
jgi:hypothetical protein